MSLRRHRGALSTTESPVLQLPDSRFGFDVWVRSDAITQFRASFGDFAAGGLRWSVPATGHRVITLPGERGAWTIHATAVSGTPTAIVQAFPRSQSSVEYPPPEYYIGTASNTAGSDLGASLLGVLPSSAAELQVAAYSDLATSCARVRLYGSDGTNTWELGHTDVGNVVGVVTASAAEIPNKTLLGPWPDDGTRLDVIAELETMTNTPTVTIYGRVRGATDTRGDVTLGTLSPTSTAAASLGVNMGSGNPWDSIRVDSSGITTSDVTVSAYVRDEDHGDPRHEGAPRIPIIGGGAMTEVWLGIDAVKATEVVIGQVWSR